MPARKSPRIPRMLEDVALKQYERERDAEFEQSGMDEAAWPAGHSVWLDSTLIAHNGAKLWFRLDPDELADAIEMLRKAPATQANVKLIAELEKLHAELPT